jgi:hypothetical protein
MAIEIFLDDIDITKYCINTDELKYSVGEYGQLFSIDTYKIKFNNISGIFDPNSPNSPFFNNELSNHKIVVYTNDLVTCEGFVYSCQANEENNASELTLTPSNSLKLDMGCTYSSDEITLTPSAVIAEICELYNIPYDSASFAGSSSVYELDQVYVSAFFKNESSIREAIQQIAEIGCARVYMYKNKMYYRVYQEIDPDTEPIIEFNGNSENGIVDLWSVPQAVNLNKQKITGYEIKYVDVDDKDAVTTFNSEGEVNKTIDGSYGSSVRIIGLQSAEWIGNKWIEFLSKSQINIIFRCSQRFGAQLDLYQLIQINYNGQTDKYNIIGISTNELYTELVTENI